MREKKNTSYNCEKNSKYFEADNVERDLNKNDVLVVVRWRTETINEWKIETSEVWEMKRRRH